MEADWNLTEAIEYYRGQNVSQDQQALIELCAGPRCQKRECARLHAFIEKNYQVKNGGISAKGGFSYRLTGCMKNCANGPSMKWDGKLYSQATPELLRSLIEKGQSNILR